MIRKISVVISNEEALLIDWLLTMHSYDYGRLEQLKSKEMVDLRGKVAPLIVSEREGTISFSPSELEYLLISCPITFRFLESDIGYSLKKKLLTAMLPFEIKFKDEVKEEKKDATDDNSTSEDNSKDSAEDFPSA